MWECSGHSPERGDFAFEPHEPCSVRVLVILDGLLKTVEMVLHEVAEPGGEVEKPRRARGEDERGVDIGAKDEKIEAHAASGARKSQGEGYLTAASSAERRSVTTKRVSASVVPK